MKFELNEPQIMTIGKALEQMPFVTVAPVIAELQRQINEQQVPQESKVEALEGSE